MPKYYKAAFYEGNIYTIVDRTFVSWVLDLIDFYGYENLQSRPHIDRKILDEIIVGKRKAISDSIVDELLCACAMEKTMKDFSWFSKEQLEEKSIPILC